MFKCIWLIRDRAYWRSRSESLETKLESERAANRRFEREMISRIVTLTGQMGIESATPTKRGVARPIPPPPQPTEQIIQGLTPQQVEDWQMYEEDAAANGIGARAAWDDFWQKEVLPKVDVIETEDIS